MLYEISLFVDFLIVSFLQLLNVDVFDFSSLSEIY